MILLGREKRRTDKAALFEDGNGEIWIPLKALIRSPEGLRAPQWAIESGRKFMRKGR